MIAHAGLIAKRMQGRWRGVLITGPSGAGKSDLALRALNEGFRLIADDRVLLWRSGERVFGKAPETLRGLIEVRGVGVLAEPALELAEIALVVDCAAPGSVERMPDDAAESFFGVEIPRLRLDPREVSAAAKLGRGFIGLGLRP